MYIKDLFKSNKTVISLETFPPKQNSDFDSVMNTINEIALMKPDYISVTYGAGGGGTSKNTVKIASKIENELKISALAHLNCVSSTKDEIKTILNQLKQNNIHNILALRGDIPADSNFPNPLNYKYAYELIKDIKDFGQFCIAGACYPECHFECDSLDKDIENLKIKVDTGCDFLITQMFFDNNKMYSFLDKVRSKNINVPIEAGIMPITNPKQIGRIVDLSSATIPDEFRRLLDKYSNDAISLRQAGIEYALKQIHQLINYKIDGIHIYIMNKPKVAKTLMDSIVR